MDIYRLVMKAGSSNFRDSSVWGIMQRLAAAGLPMIIYESKLTRTTDATPGTGRPWAAPMKRA